MAGLSGVPEDLGAELEGAALGTRPALVFSPAPAGGNRALKQGC
jgi:hypothetical protein